MILAQAQPGRDVSCSEAAPLYPLLNPFDAGQLKVDDIHTLYYEQSGNPAGVPVVFLHGGPGAGSSPKQRQFFDPRHYRIVIFDQRGAGKSTPQGELRQNTTAHLVADIEQLRKHLRIDRWHAFGGSWGSTLALAYAIQHPARVLSLTLRGIFLMRQREMEHFLYGMRTTFPEAWEDFAGPLSVAERGDILSAYYRLLTHPDPKIHLPAVLRWSAYEHACLRLIPEKSEAIKATENSDDIGYAYAIARLECHYFVHNRFDPDDYLLRNVDKIRHIPCVIVQGRYDVICPPVTAYELHKHWPEAQFIIVPDAGHSSSEPGTVSELVKAMDGFRGIKL
jgi:proline iminopeptidase